MDRQAGGDPHLPQPQPRRRSFDPKGNEGNAMSVELDKKCRQCGSAVRQRVFFEDEDGRITIQVWQDKCPFCGGPLEEPTPEEVRRALTFKGM